MPVELERIPDQKPKPSRPATLRWLIFGVVLILAWMGGAFLFWQGSREGGRFWFLALALPLLLWGMAFVFRRGGYKLLSVGSESANQSRERRLRIETERGQRFAWYIGEHLINALEEDHQPTQEAAIRRMPVLVPVSPVNGGTPVRHSALSIAGKTDDRLSSYLADIVGQANRLLASIPKEMTCYLALDTGGSLADICGALQAEIQRPLLRIRNLSGFSILDYWLDHHYNKPAVLLIISAQLQDLPQEDSGEAISVLLMSNCRLKDTPETSVKLHRPQICVDGNLNHALARTLLWSALDKTSVLRGWISGGALSSNETLSMACGVHAPTLTADRVVNIDTVAGFTGVAAPWQAILLAARQCLTDKEPQLIVIESSSDLWQLCTVTPEE